MLNSEKIVVSVCNNKNGAIDKIYEFVRLKVRYYEHEKVRESIKDMLDAIQKTHAGIDAMACSDDDAREYLAQCDGYTAEDAEKFIAQRKELVALNEEISDLHVTIDDYDNLKPIDKTFIDLQAHTAVPAILIDEDILKDSNADIKSIVEKYYVNGNLKDTKDKLRSMFNRILGEEGDLFYAVKLKKSDLDSEQVRNFLARFRGKAQRTKITKDGVTEYGQYKYVKGEKYSKTQLSAVTDYFAVTLDRRNDYTVIK